ncbi:hypothetical protein [Flagellimonas meridianipacifica]|uniref:Uncharacterized protein n=1 Tax=Flagellimonas meridianipacifica TaxID=1080225 RepID=A0A2T0MGG6_9FLAO|nr:hypothetical protein [Allomuricauda pacifica]PRX56655.1 hypothetical protein CLV81_0652 [Allomuricauda pacifica]
MDIDPEYLNSVVNQLILVASLLAGFSIAIVANLLTDKTESKIHNRIFKVTILTASCFLVSVFGMTKLVMMTTKGYPKNLSPITLEISNQISAISFLLGIVFLCIDIGLFGWTKSKKMGRFTTLVGILTFFLILLTLTNIEK